MQDQVAVKPPGQSRIDIGIEIASRTELGTYQSSILDISIDRNGRSRSENGY